ncbi:cytochrome P450 [Tricharina praecox]|uniref:cytochrome P450 n=1 Tax=Tricharina praecox TaxID=43433 RepID=UPI002220F7E0|nr:cytochrome P450 [Tricharina praecox]KAI5842353.1 cytochrome P450 [Tricharina praecox]
MQLLLGTERRLLRADVHSPTTVTSAHSCMRQESGRRRGGRDNHGFFTIAGAKKVLSTWTWMRETTLVTRRLIATLHKPPSPAAVASIGHSTPTFHRTTMAALADLLRYIDLWVLLYTWAVVYGLIVVRRVWFHPLSHVPGPPLAAATYMYFSWYQVLQDGAMWQQLPALHEKYGPAVRISPTDVDIMEPELYHQVFGLQTTYLKDHNMYKLTGLSRSSALTCDPVEHRARRSLVNPFFSKKAINDACSTVLSPIIENFCDKLDAFCASGAPVPLANGFYCVTVDIISQYCFGRCWNMLDEPNFTSDWVESVLSISDGINIRLHFPMLTNVLLFVSQFVPSLVPLAYKRLMEECQTLVRASIASVASARTSGAPRKARPSTVIEAIIDPPPSSSSSKEAFVTPFQDLVEEAVALTSAGTDSTSNCLQYCVWHFLTKPEVRARLLVELDAVERDADGRFSLARLEGLAYFTGFLQEVLRYNHIAPTRLPRVVPTGGLTIPSTGLHLPQGTSIAFYITLIHMDPRLFESPEEFRPERWMGEEGKVLNKWLVSFSKGDRGCLGVNLAYAELYLVLANLLTRYEIELWETNSERMEWSDHGVARPKERIQVKVRRRVKA